MPLIQGFYSRERRHEFEPVPIAEPTRSPVRNNVIRQGQVEFMFLVSPKFYAVLGASDAPEVSSPKLGLLGGGGDVVMLDATKESSAWMRILINSVCKAFYCQPFLRDGSTALVIIGVAADAEVALCTYRYLYDTVIRLAGDFWKSGLAPEGKGVLTSYCLGVVSSISDTLDTIAARNEQASPEGPNAIVLMRKAREGRIDDFLKDEVQVGGEFKGKHKITDRLAYLSGRKDGRAVKIAPDKALA